MAIRPGGQGLLIGVLLIIWCSNTAGAGELSIDSRGILDSAGRRITLSQPFKRIISLYGAHTENLYTMGAQDQLIGVTPHDDYPPGVKSKSVHSYHDDLEKFLMCRPDLVLIRPMIDRGYAQLIRRLEASGITVVSLQPSTPSQMYVYWRILGHLTGRSAVAEEMVVRFEATIDDMRRLTATIEDKKRVYFEAIHDRMRTFAPSAMPIFTLETAGGINVAKDAAPRRGTNIADYGKERILSHAHDIDVYLAQSGPMNHPTREKLKAEPGYDIIRAIRNDQIFIVDEKLVSRPTMRMLEGICFIGSMLYPDLFEKRFRSTACKNQARGAMSHKANYPKRINSGTQNKELNQ